MANMTRRRTVELPDHPDFLWVADQKPKKSYDVIIIGAGGHGLATAYYLAKNHGITNVAVIEKGWLAGGNMGRNTTIIRSNYLWDESAGIYDHSLKLWENLEEEVGYEMFFSQRGVMTLAHSVSDVRSKQRNFYANHVNAVDSVWLTPEEVKEIAPIVNISEDIRYPVMGATFQPRGGIAKHDWVAWGYAKAAADIGVDIIQNCEVTGIRREGNAIVGIETIKGFIKTKKVGLVAAGHSSVVASMAGIRLPIESHPLQALVSESMKPIFPTVVMSNAIHAYISQSDKGDLVIGAGIDSYAGYGQRGSFQTIEQTLKAIIEMFPIFSRVRMNRQWGGIVDVSPDACPIIGLTPIKGLYINCGWGTGGFKATPSSGWVMAHTIAQDRPHYLNEPFSLNRFNTGHLIDEHGAAAVAH